MQRRKFLTTGAIGAAATALASPAHCTGQTPVETSIGLAKEPARTRRCGPNVGRPNHDAFRWPDRSQTLRCGRNRTRPWRV